jgi:hypothetical protein
MSSPEENASVAAPENEETAETPEPPTAEAAATTDEPQPDTPASDTADDDSGAVGEGAPESLEVPDAMTPDEDGVQPRYVEREALVAPDLSDLPDDIGDDFERPSRPPFSSSARATSLRGPS